MDMNNEQTVAYVEYRAKVDEIWQEQVDAGGMFGRADLREVFQAFKNLKERIERDSILSQEYKNELLGNIIEKMELARSREEEILKAEEEWSQDKVEAFKRMNNRFEGLPAGEKEKYNELYQMWRKGYDIFFTEEQIDSMFNGQTSCEKMKEELAEKYPVISRDFKEVFKKIEENQKTAV